MTEPWDDPLSVRYLDVMRSAAESGLRFDRIFDPDLPEHERGRMFDWYRRMHREIRVPMAHAIPTPESVHIIGLFSPVIEIGAGSGYWADLIRNRTGAQVFAYDKVAGDGVLVTDNIREAIAHHPDATLFLCWPDQSEMSSEAIQYYNGETLLYIGESMGRTAHGDFSQTGSVSFHLYLNRYYHEVLRLDLPRWPGNRDCFSVYRRSRSLTLAIGESESVETCQHVPGDESLRLHASSDFGDDLVRQAKQAISGGISMSST